MFFKYEEIDRSASHFSNAWLNCYTSVKVSNVAMPHLAQPDLITQRFSPGELSRNHTVVVFVIAACHSFLFIPLFLFVNPGELLLTRGSLRWEWAALDHFRDRPKTTPSFPCNQGVYFSCSALSVSASETSSLSVLVTRSVCVAALVEADSVLVNGMEVIC